MSGTVHAGISGNKGIVAKVALPPAAAIDYDGDIKAMRIVGADKDDADLTFAEAAEGETKDYSLNVTANQSTAVGSFWRLLYANPGAEFTVVYGPHGNVIPTDDEPHFTMTVKANGRPEIGSTARRGKERETFDYVLEVTAGPVLDDGS